MRGEVAGLHLKLLNRVQVGALERAAASLRALIIEAVEREIGIVGAGSVNGQSTSLRTLGVGNHTRHQES